MRLFSEGITVSSAEVQLMILPDNLLLLVLMEFMFLNNLSDCLALCHLFIMQSMTIMVF